MTLTGALGDDAKHYAEEQVRRAGAGIRKSDRYHESIEWSKEDQVYVGTCPDLISGIHGDDPVRLYAELCEVVDDVVEHFDSQGRALPTPKTRPMQEVP